MHLNKTINSSFNPKITEGNKGEEVEIIRIDNHVALVRRLSDNNKFSCNINDLTEETQIAEKPIEEVIIKQKINWLPPKKQEGTIQTTLF